MSNNNQTPATTNSNSEIAVAQPTQSERFTMAVMKEFTANAGDVQLTNFQRKLIQNYFIKLDMTLKENEVKRISKSEQYRDPLEFIWKNVNMSQLALDVVAYSSIGLDPLQDNHINLIPYKNKKTNQFDIGFIIGYEGMKIKAVKYGFEVPDDVIVELVYSNDVFKSHKKNKDNQVESYTFDIVNDFDRGEVIGGFYYHVFRSNPEKNRLKVMTMKDINKRIPKNASPEFWGGEKKKWNSDEVEQIDGWYEEMVEKMLKRAAYNSITIDSEKIDDHLVKMMQAESLSLNGSDQTLLQVKSEVANNANKQELGFSDAQVIDIPHTEEKKPEPVTANPPVSAIQPNENPQDDGPVAIGF
ncbi:MULTISPECIES: recombinase RecT [Sphingobacterium]|uniref:recombinase RecT n=1 Tax=Sphingobacterium TaxID=28453 RepID=UPI00257A27B7|nr:MULTISPECIES: recombinase RecT [Sphingobacterium]